MERVFSGRLQYRPEGDEKTQHAVSYLTHICLKGKIYLLKIFLKLGWRWSVQHRDMGLSHSLCPFVGVFVLWRLQQELTQLADVHAPESCKSITKQSRCEVKANHQFASCDPCPRPTKSEWDGETPPQWEH